MDLAKEYWNEFRRSAKKLCPDSEVDFDDFDECEQEAHRRAAEFMLQSSVAGLKGVMRDTLLSKEQMESVRGAMPWARIQFVYTALQGRPRWNVFLGKSPQEKIGEIPRPDTTTAESWVFLPEPRYLEMIDQEDELDPPSDKDIIKEFVRQMEAGNAQ